MSAYNIYLKPSHAYRGLLLLLALVPLLIMALTPAPLAVLVVLLLLCLWFYSAWYRLFAASHNSAYFTLVQDCLHWQTPCYGQTQLCRGGLVSQQVLRLNWQAGGKIQQRWVFADQCSDEAFRALARAINQRNWQA